MVSLNSSSVSTHRLGVEYNATHLLLMWACLPGWPKLWKGAQTIKIVGVHCQNITCPKVVGVFSKMVLPFQNGGCTLSKYEAPKTGGCVVFLNSSSVSTHRLAAGLG